MTYHVNIDNTCVACKSSKHPLYTSTKLRSLPHKQMMAILKEHEHCIDSLKPAHFVKQCPCGQKCRKCKGPHFTWLHIMTEDWKQKKGVSPFDQTPGTATQRSRLGGHHPIVVMCQVQTLRTDGSTTKTRALLDSASCTSFSMENLAQLLGQ